MLAFLLLQHDCPVDRNEAAVCWKKTSDTELWESEARASLAHAVSALTVKLGIEGRRLQKPKPQLLLFETTGADLDLRTWEAALEEGSVEALESIAPLYRLPLLEGWDDPWVLHARQRLHNDYVQALRSAARRETDHGEWRTALRAFKLLAEIDSTHAETLLEHLKLLADRRRFKEMQRVYNAYVRHGEALLDPIDSQTAQRYRELRTAATLRQDGTQNGWLPKPLSHFVPRPTEVQEVCDWVRSERLTTLTGTGGIGKTRLAIAVAEEIQEEFYDRAWFIDLSELQNPSEVPTQVARALSLSENVGRTTTEEIVAFLRAKEALLILDNCEQVLEASARLTASVLENCPETKILATSREPLGIIGESLWRVPSLAFPEIGTRVRPTALGKFSAVRLLLDRASRPQVPLTLDTHNADPIARICRLLDGIPLAIELAAVQISRRLKSIQEVADSMEQSLSLLTEGSSTAPSRQQTLRAAIEWSYRLLSEGEQRVFERLGVFVGGFTERAACEVCGDTLLNSAEVAHAVATLADKSLTERVLPEQEPRYHLLQTIRQFALEKLASRSEQPSPAAEQQNGESGDVSTTTYRSHLIYFAAFAEKAERHHRGPEQALWLDRQAKEHENYRAALTWALENGDCETGLRLAGHLAVFLYARGYHSEAVEWLTAFLECTNSTAPARVKALQWLGNIHYSRGDYAVAHTYFTQGLALREIVGDRRSIAIGRASLASVSGEIGSHQEALTLFEANLPIFRDELNDLTNTAQTWHSIAMMQDALGDLQKARDAYRESYQLFLEIQDSAGVGLAASNLAGIYIRLEEYPAVCPLLAECVAIYRTLQTRPKFVFILIHYACLAMKEQDFGRATLIFGFEQAFRERIGHKLPQSVRDHCIAEMNAARTQLGEAGFNRQFAIGTQTPESEMIALLLAG